MWGFNKSQEDIWVPDPVLFLKVELIQFSQMKNNKKKTKTRRRRTTKRFTKDKTMAEDSILPEQVSHMDQEINTEIILTLDSRDSIIHQEDYEEVSSIGSSFSIVENDSEKNIKPNETIDNQQAYTEGKKLQSGFFSKENLKDLKEKGALNILKNPDANANYENQLQFDTQIENKQIVEKHEKVQKQKKIFSEIVSALNLESFNIRQQTFKDLKKLFDNNGGIDDQIITQNKNEDQTISISKSQLGDKVLFELIISLATKPNDRLKILITYNQDLKTFLRQIKEAMEQNYPNFNGLNGLNVNKVELEYKQANEKGQPRQRMLSHLFERNTGSSASKSHQNSFVNNIKSTIQVFKLPEVNNQAQKALLSEQENLISSQIYKQEALQQSKMNDSGILGITKLSQNKYFPQDDRESNTARITLNINNETQQDEPIRKFITKNDRCYVYMESQDIWLEVELNVSANGRQFVSTFGIKIDQQTTGKDLKKVIQKIAIQTWNQMAADQNLMGKQLIKEPDENFLIKTIYNTREDFDDSRIGQGSKKFTQSVNTESRNTMYKPEFYEYIINRVQQLLGADLFYVLTSIDIQYFKQIQKSENESVQLLSNRHNSNRPSKEKLTANMQYRSLVAQERQMLSNQNTTIDKNEDTLILSGKGRYSIKKVKKTKGLQVLQELVKIGDDELIKDMFDYEKNNIKVDCSFQTIFEYFQTYQNKMYEQVLLVDSLPQVNNVMKSFQDKQFEQIQNNAVDQRDQFSQISEFQAQAFENSVSDESLSAGPTKRCNDEQMFVWNLANIDSAIIEKVLIPNIQNKKGSFSGHEKFQQRFKYWAMLRNKEIFQNLLSQGQQNKSRKSLINLNRTGGELSMSFNNKSELKSARKSGILDRFFRQNTESSSKHVKNTKILRQNENILQKSHNETADFKQEDQNDEQQNKFELKVQKQSKSESHQKIIDSRQLPKKSLQRLDPKQSILTSSPERFQEEFDLLTYMDSFSIPNQFNKNSDLVQKRFMLQNRVHSSILLQSKKEMNNKLLYYRHLLIKNSINLIEKKQVNNKNKTNQYFKALEITNDQINPAIYFQINQILNGDLNFPKSQIENSDKISIQFANTNKSQQLKHISNNQVGQKLQEDIQQIQQNQKLQNLKNQINSLQLNQIKEADDEAENTLHFSPELIKQQQSASSYQSENSDLISKDSRASSMNQKHIALREEESLSESSEEEDFARVGENLAYDLPVRSKSIIQDQYFDRPQVKKFSDNSYSIKEKPSDEFSLVSQVQKKNTNLTFYKSQGQKSSITSHRSDTVMDKLYQDDEQVQQEPRHNSVIMFKNEFQPIVIQENEIQEESQKFKNQIETESFKQKQADVLEFSYSQKSSKQIKENNNQGSPLHLGDVGLGPRTFQVSNLLQPIQNFEDNEKFERQSLKVSRASNVKFSISNMQTEIHPPESKESFANQKEGFRTRISKFFSVFGDKKKNEVGSGQNTARVNGYNKNIITVPGSPSIKSQHFESKQNSLHTKYQQNSSPKKVRLVDLSVSQSLNLDQKQKPQQTKSILQYFQKQSNATKNEEFYKTNSLVNNLFDLSQASGISNEVFQHVINERINNGMNKQKTINLDDQHQKIARDLVSKALMLGGGNYLQEMINLEEEQCKILMNQARNLSNPKDVNKNNQLQQLLVLGYQMQLAMLIPLPEFLLTSEEYQQIKEPPIVNLIYQEVKSNQKQLALNSQDNATKDKRKQNCRYIAVGFLILILIAIVITISVLFTQGNTDEI